MAHDRPREPLETEEAIRLITMTLRVTKIEPPGEYDGQALPIVHFKGTSEVSRSNSLCTVITLLTCAQKSMRPLWDVNANSKIRGQPEFALPFQLRR